MNLYRETKWLRFIIADRKPKTVVMHVMNTSHRFLGERRWYGPWRQYTFNSVGGITFNNGCLQDIVDVLSSLNKEHR